MKSFTLRGVILMVMSFHYYVCLGNSESILTSLTESTSVQDLIFDNIYDDIKKTLWIEVANRLEALESKVNDIENNDNCDINCMDLGENGAHTEHVTDNTAARDQELLILLIKGLKNEKLKSRKLEISLKKANNMISGMESEIKTHKDRINRLEQRLSNVQMDSQADRQMIASLQKSHNDLVQDSILMNKTLHETCYENENKINKPSFVSDWILMRAQDPKFVNATVFHGLGMLPYKVDVQIQASSGPNTGWIFPGDSAYRADDDLNEVYGGVVYLYDETNVYLSVPIKSNNYDLGVIINTGESKSRRLGNHHQTATEAYVRVRVWAQSDLPEPDMKTEWLPVDISNKSLTHYELLHGLKDYPGLVNVQIRCMSPDNRTLISEGIGATVGSRDWLNGGGVVHAFNKSLVRIWTGYIDNNLKRKQDIFYTLFGIADGWGNIPGGFDYRKGHVRILAWKQSTVTGTSIEFDVHDDKNDITELATFDQFSAENDLFSLYVEANEGANQGFRFSGFGNSQATGSPFGGVVYAYSSTGEVRTWRPNPATGGHLIHVHSPYGNGVNTQVSNNARYVSTLLRSK